MYVVAGSSSEVRPATHNHLHDPGLIRHYVPDGAVHFVRVYSCWEEEKVHRLRGYGIAHLDKPATTERVLSVIAENRRREGGIGSENLVA